jgi:hypothetical protein
MREPLPLPAETPGTPVTRAAVFAALAPVLGPARALLALPDLTAACVTLTGRLHLVTTSERAR